MTKTFLALGDSYTIGEAVLITESFAYQTTALLRSQGFNITAPEIIAKTGFTTDELKEAISKHTLATTYDVVSLLIGVNNQYRGRDVQNFEAEFEELLQFALKKANNNSAAVFVLSIPDWGVTPFAKDRDKEKIAIEIDVYNSACKKIAMQYNCIFIDITTFQRADAHDAEMLASDGLHPSAKEYKKWAVMLADVIFINHSS
jgi:lysophospholipase L1-like esterase